MVGVGAQHQQEYGRAHALHREALTILEEFGAEAWVHCALFNLAWTAHGMKDDSTAAAYAEQLQAVAASTHDAFAAGVTQLILGDLALAAGRRAAALARYRNVLATSRHRGDRWLAADAFVGFAGVLAAGDEPERGARLLGAAEALYQRVCVPFPPRDRPDFPAWVAAIQTRLEPGVFDRAWTAGASLTLTEAAQDAMAITAEGVGRTSRVARPKSQETTSGSLGPTA
jgi:hypothetical protein